MFLRKLALSVGRLDFWNLTNELTPYELAVHAAAMRLEPVGEDREDLRLAMQTLALIQSTRTKALTADETQSIAESLLRYLPINVDRDQDVTPDEAARQGKAAFARIGL